MKFYILLLTLTAIIMMIVPAASLSGNRKTETVEAVTVIEKHKDSDEDAISVFMSETETVLTLDKLEYLIGAVASEMPASYHEEALKAQAVACNTYACYIKNNPSDGLFGADISNSPKTHQGYITQEERKLRWGDNYEVYEKKIRSAVEEVQNTVITSDGEPIMAAFFAICPGRTENASEVFGRDIAYLKSVTSDGDKLSPNYSKTINFTQDEFKERILKIDGIDIGEDPSEWIGEAVVSEVGTVKTIEVCGSEITGERFRSLFDLRSSAFTVSYSDESFTVKTVGYGHFVGMSQYGADYMARQGATYKEILNHYYSGVTINDE